MCHSFCRNGNVGFSGCNNLEIKCWACDCREVVTCFRSHKILFPFLTLCASPLANHVTCAACHCVELCQRVCWPLDKSYQVETVFISQSPTCPQSSQIKCALLHTDWKLSNQSWLFALTLAFLIFPQLLQKSCSSASSALKLYRREYSLIIFNDVKV